MKKLLVIGQVWPEPRTTAAGNRMLQLLEAFLENDFQIYFASTASKTEYSIDLDTIGIVEAQIQLNDSSFDNYVAHLNPEVVIFDRFMVEEQFGWRVAESCPNAIRILNTEDLHSLREYRKNAFKHQKTFTVTQWLQSDKAKREIASVFRSDVSLITSTYELQLLKDTVKIDDALLMHLPFMLDSVSQTQKASWPSFERRKDFITFGNGKHAPNLDSIKFLKKEIWPLIKKELPQANLHVYGAYLQQQIFELNNEKEGFLVQGWVADLESKVQKARVVLAPLRYGAGIKGKLTLGMQCGTPNVTTEIGAEGMHKDLPWAGSIANSAFEFAQKAVELYQNESLWLKAQTNGVELINKLYSKTHFQNKLMEDIAYIGSDLEKHRVKNVVGSLLTHQTIAATKYMGKWIEAKNKKV